MEFVYDANVLGSYPVVDGVVEVVPHHYVHSKGQPVELVGCSQVVASIGAKVDL